VKSGGGGGGAYRVGHAVPADVGGAEEHGGVEAGGHPRRQPPHALRRPLPQVQVAAPGLVPAGVHVDDQIHLPGGGGGVEGWYGCMGICDADNGDAQTDGEEGK
jgi:hypothetical protein